MASILKSLRLAADPNRLRLLLLLEREELSVAELQEILGKGQSHVSTSLALLKAAGLVEGPAHRQERLLSSQSAHPTDGVAARRRGRGPRNRAG